MIGPLEIVIILVDPAARLRRLLPQAPARVRPRGAGKSPRASAARRPRSSPTRPAKGTEVGGKWDRIDPEIGRKAGKGCARPARSAILQGRAGRRRSRAGEAGAELADTGDARRRSRRRDARAERHRRLRTTGLRDEGRAAPSPTRWPPGEEELQRDRGPRVRRRARRVLPQGPRLSELGVSRFTYGPGERFPFAHKHREQQESYVVVAGSGRMKLDDEIIELAEWDVLRSTPRSPARSKRAPTASTSSASRQPSRRRRRRAGRGLLGLRADERIRTADPFITSEVLYQLSYVGNGG